MTVKDKFMKKNSFKSNQISASHAIHSLSTPIFIVRPWGLLLIFAQVCCSKAFSSEVAAGGPATVNIRKVIDDFTFLSLATTISSITAILRLGQVVGARVAIFSKDIGCEVVTWNLDQGTSQDTIVVGDTNELVSESQLSFDGEGSLGAESQISVSFHNWRIEFKLSKLQFHITGSLTVDDIEGVSLGVDEIVKVHVDAGPGVVTNLSEEEESLHVRVESVQTKGGVGSGDAEAGQLGAGNWGHHGASECVSGVHSNYCLLWTNFKLYSGQ